MFYKILHLCTVKLNGLKISYVFTLYMIFLVGGCCLNQPTQQSIFTQIIRVDCTVEYFHSLF